MQSAHPSLARHLGDYLATDSSWQRPSGSGLGQLGIRERVASHRGEVEIGPRATGGYRVRVRLPLAAAAAGMP